jgi:hypothetical protein
LLKAGANVNVQDEEEITPLHRALNELGIVHEVRGEEGRKRGGGERGGRAEGRGEQSGERGQRVGNSP